MNQPIEPTAALPIEPAAALPIEPAAALPIEPTAALPIEPAAATPYDRGVATATRVDDLPPSGRWIPTGAGVALRVLGSVALAYLAVVGGAYRYGPALAVVSTVTMLAPFAVIVFRAADRERWATWSAVVMIVGGAVITPYVAGGYFFCGVVVLIAWGRLPTRVSVAISAAAGLLMLALVALHTPGSDGPVLVLGYAAGSLAAVLFGVNRHQTRQRQQQERDLVARSRELQQRSAELIAQTELTRAETSRAAALEERSRIARDIHDVLAHSLGGLVRQLDAAEALLVERHDIDGAADRLRSSRELAVDGLREARLAVSELRSSEPPETEQDLVAAVRKIAYGPVGLQLGVELDVLGQPVPVAGPVRDAFAAVTREALTNAAKHASVTRMSVTLEFAEASVRLEVGNPVDRPADTVLATTGGGVGLDGLRERMTAIGGSLSYGRVGNRWLVSADWSPR